jgi:hypothetical protein
MLSFFLIVLGGCCCYVSASSIKSGLRSRIARRIAHGLGLLGMGLVGWGFWFLLRP